MFWFIEVMAVLFHSSMMPTIVLIRFSDREILFAFEFFLKETLSGFPWDFSLDFIWRCCCFKNSSKFCSSFLATISCDLSSLSGSLSINPWHNSGLFLWNSKATITMCFWNKANSKRSSLKMQKERRASKIKIILAVSVIE